MRKVIAGFLCAATIMSAAIPALATEAPQVPPQSQAVAPIIPQYSIYANGKKLDLGTCQTFNLKDIIMVPLRSTSEALGFTVTWDGEKKAIHMDNGKMQADLVLGTDSYCAYSSKAIGMTQPTSLGAAPVLLSGYTYVPVNVYKILLADPNCITIKDSVITISGSSTQIPNPLTPYSTLDAARKAVGFNFAVPASIPDGYKMGDIIVISNDLAEIFYKNGDKEILYRTAKGNEDISGNYTVYDKVRTITLGNTAVTVKGTADKVSLATWNKDNVSFSLSFDEAVSESTLSAIIASIK